MDSESPALFPPLPTTSYPLWAHLHFPIRKYDCLDPGSWGPQPGSLGCPGFLMQMNIPVLLQLFTPKLPSELSLTDPYHSKLALFLWTPVALYPSFLALTVYC